MKDSTKRFVEKHYPKIWLVAVVLLFALLTVLGLRGCFGKPGPV